MYDTLRFRLWYGATGNWGFGKSFRCKTTCRAGQGFASLLQGHGERGAILRRQSWLKDLEDETIFLFRRSCVSGVQRRIAPMCRDTIRGKGLAVPAVGIS